MSYGGMNMKKNRDRTNRNHLHHRENREAIGALWKILLLQMCISAAVFGGVFLLAVCFDGYWEISQGAVVSVFSQKEVDLKEKISKVYEQPWVEYVKEFLNRSIYIADEPQGMGGELPDHIEKGEVPPDCTLKQVILKGSASAPLTGTITSPFGSRVHPISKKQDFHKGLDIASAQGTPIHVVSSGTVLETGSSKSYGNFIIVRHSEHFQTAYCHCEKIIAQEGDRVRQGERIATVGSTGISTGPHLHFEVRVDGKRANPLWVLPL